MISWRMAAAWVLALVLTTVLTWQIVGLADSQVGSTPMAVAPSITPASTTTPSVASSTTSIFQATSSTSEMPESTSSSGTTATSATGSGSSSSTTMGASNSSTAATTEWSVRTINSAGGSVVVRHRPGEVELQAASPAPGFAVEVDDDGPDRVRVEFESDDLDVRVEVRWQNDQLEVDVDEDD